MIAGARTTVRPVAASVSALAAVGIARAAAILAVGGMLLFELQAMLNGYGLRVTSDTPTYLALLRDVALHPFQPVSPFLSVPGVETSHATPDMQMLALVWRSIAPDRSLVAPEEAYHLLALWGMLVTVLVAHSLFVWVRGLVGSRAAWISIPLLLGLFGPVNVIWAGDLSFHGFLYGSYFSQTFAVALLLYALHVVPKAATRRQQAASAVLVALLLLVHPFTGVLFIFLATSQAAAWAWQGCSGWQRAPWAIALGFVLGIAWPAYSLSAAMTVSGLTGTTIVAVAALMPLAVFHVGRVARPLLPTRPIRWRWPFGSFGFPLVPALAVAGVILVGIVAGWELWLATRPITDPLRPTNHLAIYWNNRLIRWPLMFGAGIAGLAGLTELARRSSRLPAFWFCLCFGIGLMGAAGLPIPLWNRLLLFCQVPLAVATAVVVARARWRIKAIVTAGFVASAAIRLLLLFYSPTTITYYPVSWIPAGYTLSQQIPAGGSAVVAADPYTSYYVPAATGHPTLLISKSHVGSEPELAAATRGYALLHQLYAGRHWQQAVKELWRQGVRYVVVDHRVVLEDPTLAAFSNNPFPLWQTAAQRQQLGYYFARLNLLGKVVADTPQYVVYKLDPVRVQWQVGS